MKSLSALLALALLCSHSARANDVVIYKYSSPRPWTQYEARDPNLAGAVPKTTLTGTYTITEYWVLDQTALTLQVVEYLTRYERGIAVKEYKVKPVTDLTTLGIREPRWIATNVANNFTLCMSSGSTNAFASGSGDSSESFLTGNAKPYTVSPGIVLPRVATLLSGDNVASEREELTDSGTGAVTNRRIFSETGTQTASLDKALTKTVYTTGTLVERATLAFGTRLVTANLERLGYDLITAP